jgi:hypothetical protein
MLTFSDYSIAIRSIEYLPLPASLDKFFPTLLPRSCDELKPSITVLEGTHASLVVVLSPLF